jgi:hypothetical protein
MTDINPKHSVSQAQPEMQVCGTQDGDTKPTLIQCGSRRYTEETLAKKRELAKNGTGKGYGSP